jgi:hypothetical protein
VIVEEKPKPRIWPRWGISPEGKRARFDCMGDLPRGWELEEPLMDPDEGVSKRGPGRPKKAA